jgi:hypothetical protein
MAINKGDIPFIGTRDGICGYWRHGINIIRKSTPLEGSRVKKDPAFKGFRKSGSRMKEASPIAAVLYNQIPKEQKIYCLYRLLTGEALKMLKAGMVKADITKKLQKQYIDPIIQEPVKLQSPEAKTNSNPKTPCKRLFITYAPKMTYTIRTSFRTERYRCRIKSVLSPLNNGLGTDLTAYG